MADGPIGEPGLDNMAWHALVGPQAHLADRSANGFAVRYRRKISMICATERTDHEAWAGLAELTRPGGVAALFRDEVPPAPDGWQELFREQVIQYVAVDLAPMPEVELIELGARDAAEMVALARLTEPGPFSSETYRTGRYCGLRRDGRLVAMAGERMRMPGWGEVSAVCVHPSAQRRGLGEAMTLAAASIIEARGDTPMLHVREGNEPAHRLYRRIGFEIRRAITVGIFRRNEA